MCAVYNKFCKLKGAAKRGHSSKSLSLSLSLSRSFARSASVCCGFNAEIRHAVLNNLKKKQKTERSKEHMQLAKKILQWL